MAEVPRYLPPSEAERAHTLARQMTPRSTLGATRDAQPVVGREIARAGARSITSGGAAASNIQTWEDIFTLAAAGAQSVTLTYLPTPDRSEDVNLNGVGATRGVDWTRSGQTLSILAPMDARVNDEVKCQYTYLVGLTGAPLPAPVLFIGGGSGELGGSYDATTWTQFSSDFSTSASSVNGLCWSPSLRLWVAVGSNSRIATSPDGQIWTSRASGVTSAFYSIAASSSILVAGAGGGQFATSPDGVTWTARTSPAWTSTDYLNSIAWSPTLGLFVLVMSGGKIATSPDGITWTARTSGTTTTLRSIAWSSHLALFVVTGDTVNLTSPDGITWTTTGGVGGYTCSASGTALLIGGGSGRIQTSTDGVTWTNAFLVNGQTIYASQWSSRLGLYVLGGAVGGTTDKNVLTSPDGVTWTERACGTTSPLYSVGAM